MEKTRNNTTYELGNVEVQDHFEDLDNGWRIILKWI
jgi:hypothetical protein